MNEIKFQSNIGLKAGTDVRPYAIRYNLLREKINSLGIKDSEVFLPELSPEMVNSRFGLSSNDIQRNIALFDEVDVAISQMVGFLNAVQKNSFRILTELEEFLFKNLRKNVITYPNEEKDIQNVIAIMLNSKGYSYQREKVRISYSAKEFIPDFTFEDLTAVLEVKFCKTDKKEKDLVDEINADILAYATKYENLTFLVYDVGIIRDTELFAKDIEKNNPRIKVLIIKQ
ncbi:MAG: hypothetical protein M1490_05690 [Candidatus Bathyarchaeota archaeon]|nr:hypothetical protein [Candidatus Bathyarchaeota archaeon]